MRGHHTVCCMSESRGWSGWFLDAPSNLNISAIPWLSTSYYTVLTVFYMQTGEKAHSQCKTPMQNKPRISKHVTYVCQEVLQPQLKRLKTCWSQIILPALVPQQKASRRGDDVQCAGCICRPQSRLVSLRPHLEALTDTAVLAFISAVWSALTASILCGTIYCNDPRQLSQGLPFSLSWHWLCFVSDILQISQWRLNRPQCCCFCTVEMSPVPRGCTHLHQLLHLSHQSDAAMVQHQRTARPLLLSHCTGSTVILPQELALPMKHFSRWAVSAPVGQSEEMRGSDENLPFQNRERSSWCLEHHLSFSINCVNQIWEIALKTLLFFFPKLFTKFASWNAHFFTQDTDPYLDWFTSVLPRQTSI